MSLSESIYIALFVMAIVFTALLGLYLSIRLFSIFFERIQKTKK